MAAVIKWHGPKVHADILKDVNNKLDQSAQEVMIHIKQSFQQGRRGQIGTSGPQGAGSSLHTDMGALQRSIFWQRSAPLTRQIGVDAASTAAAYAMTHEIGRVITPKKGKYLAIPWSREARQHSRRGGTALTFMSGGKPLRKIGKGPKTFYLVETVRGKKARSIIHYVITTRVVIPARPYLRPALDAMRPRIQEIFSQ